MIELVYIPSMPNWVDYYISCIFNPDFWPWLPDDERSFYGLIDEADIEPWSRGVKVGWAVQVDGRNAGMIWGEVEDRVLEINIYFMKWVKGKHKVEACKIAEDIVSKLGIDEVYGKVCVENKKSLAFCRYLGYKTRKMHKCIRNHEEIEYREVYKCL